jgi:hypothetical protein
VHVRPTVRQGNDLVATIAAGALEKHLGCQRTNVADTDDRALDGNKFTCARTEEKSRVGLLSCLSVERPLLRYAPIKLALSLRSEVTGEKWVKRTSTRGRFKSATVGTASCEMLSSCCRRMTTRAW